MLHGGENCGQRIEYDFSVNLNPYPCPDAVKAAIAEAAGRVNLYPDIRQTAFREAVAKAENMAPVYEVDNCKSGGLARKSFSISEKNIIGGNGASELIAAVVRMFDPRKVLLPVPSFYGYFHALNMQGKCKIENYYLSEENDFVLDERILNKIDNDVDMLILANPNNPTGKCIDEELFDKIADRCLDEGCALVVDECFLSLSTSSFSAKKYIGKIPRLFIINAYTKLFSIPGVRVGYAIASEHDIEELTKFLPEWNLSVFAEEAGIACAKVLCENEDGFLRNSFVSESLRLIENGKEQILSGLRLSELDSLGIKVFDSNTNFVLLKSALPLQRLLLDKGILIRDCSNFQGVSEGFYRIAIKDHSANEALLDALKFI